MSELKFVVLTCELVVQLYTVADPGLGRGGFQSEELEDVGAGKCAQILSHAHFPSATTIHLRQVAKV